MDPILEKVTHTSKSSFALKEDILKHIKIPWHFHPEYELTLIAEGRGKRFIGDHVENFTHGDLILIGPNLPHFWKNNSKYYEENSLLRVRAVVVHFLEDSFGKGFFDIPEMSTINKILNLSSRGIRINGNTKKIVSQKMELLLQQEGFERMNNLLNILNIISYSKELTVLSSLGFKPFQKENLDRINMVYEYLLLNYKSDISLEDIAAIVNLSPTAFCRFFKRSTGKTFSKVLNELRIGNACKKLMEESVTVSEACYESGYNNLSYFNRQFKEITKSSPLKYRKRFERESTPPELPLF